MADFRSESVSLKDGRTLTLRSLRAEDAALMRPFFEQIGAETTHTLQYVGRKYPEVEETAERLAREEKEEVTLNLSAFDGDRLVACLHFRAQRADHPWLRHHAHFGMMVLQDYWGQGLATALLHAQERHAQKIGVTRIEAHVRAKNDRAVRLYLKTGFRIEGVRRGEALINGMLENSYFIAKTFPTAAGEVYATADALLRKEDPVSVAQGLALLREKVEHEPGNAKAWFEYAGAFDGLGREAEALPHYAKALALGFDKLPEEDRPRLFLQMGSTLRNLQRFEEAKATLQQGIEAFPGCGALRAFLGLTHYSTGDFREAARVFLQASLSGPTDTSFTDFARALRFYADTIDTFPAPPLASS